MAESLDGAFEVREIIEDDLSFHGYGVAQGGMVDTPDGDWYAFMMQDRGGVGRVPILMPMRFGEDGFPVVGENGKVPQSVSVPAASCAEPVTPINGSEFIARYNAEGGVDADCLQPYWQFNHIPHNEYWSLTERPGAFRLHSGRISSNLNHAWNTLTQRTMGPVTVAEVTVDASTLHDGDFAGLAAFQGCYSYIALTRRNGRTMLTVQYKPVNDDSIFSDDDWDSPAVTDAEIMADADCMRLRAVYDFTDCKDEVTFFYRDADTPESEWCPLGTAHRMIFKMDHFTGCRIGLFLYSTKETGGIADFYDLRIRRRIRRKESNEATGHSAQGTVEGWRLKIRASPCSEGSRSPSSRRRSALACAAAGPAMGWCAASLRFRAYRDAADAGRLR